MPFEILVIEMKKNKTALMTAAELLAKQEQSSNRLRQKLTSRKFDSAEIDAAIDTLKNRNYLDDEETCRRQFENFYSEGKMSVKQICAKLIQRGFDSEFVKNLIPEDSDEHDLKAAIYLLEKKFAKVNFDKENTQEFFKLKNKIYQHLAMKGFTSEIISSAAENFLSKCDV